MNLVDLVKNFSTRIYSQKSASIQPRTSLSKVIDSAAGENTELVVSRLLRADLVHVLNTQLLACYQEENTLTHTMLNSIESYVFAPFPRDFTFYEREVHIQSVSHRYVSELNPN